MPRPYDTPATRALLGTMADQAVATQLGIRRTDVTKWRRALGISALGPTSHRPPPKARQALLAWLRRHPEGLTSVELRLLEGVSRQAVHQALRRMEALALVRAVRSRCRRQAVRWFLAEREE